MTLYNVKPFFQSLLRPCMFALAKKNITANQVTVAALILSCLTGLLLFLFPVTGLYAILPLVLFIRMALNALDGMLARECNQQSFLGAALNEFGDVFSDIALYFPFLVLPGSCSNLLLLMLFLIIMTEFSGVLAQAIKGARSYAGPMGKSDRALVFGAWGLALSCWPSLLIWCNTLWAIITLLLVLTVVNRCRSVLSDAHS
ncbi:TPA: CDP-alcohol phosphatidyltransferase family protein [Kluyvera georgiana]|uniref:CDP-alcohol phosphatidyltransferase family protein n=1 Tax=Kluyvera georgiana TaxID=73098 RepID=UPI0008070AF9|nr:CDP-alcohol phosphatidyltransferase family protein [Kluyvera georgiana]MDA8494836.1 CDP-alcohol phosphatidyltransferase family protein [Kluyvera georgiana]HDG1690124.1 CDP-alcohol phosphatidyltransferase family protein [Kluyvera georgiana]HED1418597.1 CDP-alcohol phosphatidyltransferase family protein [Kluyvera georgiana]